METNATKKVCDALAMLTSIMGPKKVTAVLGRHGFSFVGEIPQEDLEKFAAACWRTKH